MNKANYMKNEYSLMELWEKNAILTFLIGLMAQHSKNSGDVISLTLISIPLIWIMFEWVSSTWRKEPPQDGHRFYITDLINSIKKKKQNETLAHGAGCSYEKVLNKNNENIKEEVK